MELKEYKHLDRYLVYLDFGNNQKLHVDLEELVKTKLAPEEMETGKIDTDWGCLEFGNVDIEPNTLYKYANEKGQRV